LHRLFVSKGKLLHLAQESNEVIQTLVQEKKTFVNT
jgi:hypothetical protein